MRVRVPRAVSGMDPLKASSAPYTSTIRRKMRVAGGGLARKPYDATSSISALKFSPARCAAVRASGFETIWQVR